MQELGGIGAPTFQVLDPEGKAVAILWGHDRLNIVADLLCGWREIEERDRATQETNRKEITLSVSISCSRTSPAPTQHVTAAPVQSSRSLL